MPQLVADCPRCGAEKITFDLTAHTPGDKLVTGQKTHEAFCICRHCNRSTVFVIWEADSSANSTQLDKGVDAYGTAINMFFRVKEFISTKDMTGVASPEYLPSDIGNAFSEAATCLAVGCYNAAATMFRLCIDLATKSRVPKDDEDGLNNRIRRSLGLRLQWLFDHGRLHETLRELSSCIKEDGNDGAHDGTLSKADAEDVCDFTKELLTHLYTAPERLRLAEERREQRRKG